VGKFEWIKDLVRAEQQMEESGVVDFSAGFDPDKQLHDQTINFLTQIKDAFVEHASAFNQMKGAAFGGIKIYGIAKTDADFMLFRNGFKLIFSMKTAGLINIGFQYQGSGFVPGTAAAEKIAESLMNEDKLEARWGAYGEIIWTHKELQVNSQYLVRYYLTRFIRESAK
jgi:hypothetical protein